MGLVQPTNPSWVPNSKNHHVDPILIKPFINMQVSLGFMGNETTLGGGPTPYAPTESQSKPGIKMVYPEACKELRSRPKLFLAGTAPY